MATWIAHLRVAEGILEICPTLERIAFLMGSIAPDSGVPNEDWSVFTPNKNVSHFRGTQRIEPERFREKYMAKELWEQYDGTHKAFYLGYYTHLLTDCDWADKIYLPEKAQFGNLPQEFKRDWYDLDFLYLEEHPDFAAFLDYERAVGFRNIFMEEFAEDAFENRRGYIVSFYRAEHKGIHREYPYLAKPAMDRFVAETAGRCAEAAQLFMG